MNINELPQFQSFTAEPGLLNEKVILVTGAGAGIGKAMALAFAQHGATVILCGRTTQKLEAVYDEIEAAGGPTPAIYPLCLEGATDQDYLEMQEHIAKAFGHLDGLLHNAGLLGSRAPLANYRSDLWEQVMKVNVTAEFMLTKAMLPLLEKSDSGAILFTSSSVGKTGRAFWGAYSVSKFAVEGLCQVLADELDGTSKIRANCINPGAVRTAMRAAAYPAEDPASLKTPETLAPAYLFLMSDASRDISGVSLDY